MESIREFRTNELKSYVLGGKWLIDEIVNPTAMTTLLHESVTTYNEEAFDFLLSQNANWMARDHNGYTPLLKAASIGHLYMTKQLVEVWGVDPRHKDPYGNTSLDKAKLFENYKVVKYLKEVTKKIEDQEKALEEGVEIPESELVNQVDWTNATLYHRGRYRTFIDYKSW